MKAPQGWLFYDGECSLCVAMARRFGRWLRRRGIEVRPLQASGVPERLALGRADLLKEMRFLTKAGDVFGGAEAVVRIARQTGWGWPLFALSRLPGARPLLSGGYRWIARRRKCGAGACGRGQPQPWLDWLPLAVFPVLVLQPALPAWGFMWAMAFAIFFGCKWLTWRKACEAGAQPNLWRSLTYLLAWPGMDAGEFLGGGKVGSGAAVPAADAGLPPSNDSAAGWSSGRRDARCVRRKICFERSTAFSLPLLLKKGGEGRGEEALLINFPSLRLSPRSFLAGRERQNAACVSRAERN